MLLSNLLTTKRGEGKLLLHLYKGLPPPAQEVPEERTPLTDLRFPLLLVLKPI